MPSTVQAPDVFVRHVCDHLGEFRVLTEEALPDEGPVFRFESLVFTVDRLFHALFQQAFGVAHQQWIPVGTPDQFDHVPAGAAEFSFQFLDDLAVTPHRSVQALQVAVDDKHQVVQPVPPGKPNSAHGFGFVHFSVTDKGPDLAVFARNHFPVLQIAHKTRLVDGLDRPEPH